jgi:hypothetical protein
MGKEGHEMASTHVEVVVRPHEAQRKFVGVAEPHRRPPGRQVIDAQVRDRRVGRRARRGEGQS